LGQTEKFILNRVSDKPPQSTVASIGDRLGDVLGQVSFGEQLRNGYLGRVETSKGIVNSSSATPFADLGSNAARKAIDKASASYEYVYIHPRFIHGETHVFGTSQAEQLEAARAAQARAEAARDRLLDGIESALEGFVLYDADDRMVAFNSRFEELFAPRIEIGMLFEDLIRSSAENGLVPFGELTPEEWIAQRLKRHRNPGPPFKLRLNNGIWIRISEGRTRDGGLVGAYTNITELEEQREHLEELVARTEAATERAEAAQRQLLDAIESSSEGFALYDADDRLVVYNSRYREIFAGPECAVLPARPPFVEAPGTPFEVVIRSFAESALALLSRSTVSAFSAAETDRCVVFAPAAASR
jgi:PAS domain-containing protein